MDTLRVDICYRPLRIAWVVAKGDLAGLRKAIRLSQMLWGGRYNPIVVADEPELAARLIELFRVDFIWPVGSAPEATEFEKRFPHLIVPFFGESLFHGDSGPESRCQILDISNALATIASSRSATEIKNQDFRIYNWDESDPLADLFLIQFGVFPAKDEIPIDYSEQFNRTLTPTQHQLAQNVEIPADVFDHPSLAYLARHNLRPHYGLSAGWDFPGFYVGDSSNFADLVSYWNLRAAGISLFFVDPAQSSRFAKAIPRWTKICEDLVAQRPQHSRHVACWTRFEKPETARSIFGKDSLIRTSCPVRDEIWNGGNVRAPMMHFGNTQALATIGRSGGAPRVSFQLGDKPFASDSWFYPQHLAASVSFGIGLFGNRDFTLDLPYVPELNEPISRTMHFHYSKLRIEPKRIGIVIGATDFDAALSAMPVSRLFELIFERAGFSTQLSKGGLIARQLITQLGGLQGARVFKIPGVRRLIKTYSPTKSFSRQSALQLIGGTDTDGGGRFQDHKGLYIEQRPRGGELTQEDVFAYLVEKGLFRIGVELTCNVCRLPSWYPIDNAAQRVHCSLCGNEYDASRQLTNLEWSYRRSGILGVEKNNQGAVPVVLTLQQLDANHFGDDGYYMPSLDFTPEGEKKKFEVDLVWMSPRPQELKTTIILGECKDRHKEDDLRHKGIDGKDIANLRRLADALPKDRFEVFFLLTKLRSFTSKEIALARTLNGPYQSRVIMLTARELEPYHILERTKVDFDINGYAASADDLALATAKIYFSELPEPDEAPK